MKINDLSWPDPKANPMSLGDVMRAFKSISAINANKILGRSGQPLWQRNYYERIIRNDEELNNIRQYIHDYPGKGATDTENPTHPRRVKP